MASKVPSNVPEQQTAPGRMWNKNGPPLGAGRRGNARKNRSNSNDDTVDISRSEASKTSINESVDQRLQRTSSDSVRPLSMLQLRGSGANSINLFVAKHKADSPEELRRLFETIRVDAPSMSPRTAANYLQVTAKLVGETPRLNVGQEAALSALVGKFLSSFEDIHTPTSAQREMKKVQMTTRDVALAAWSLGRLELNQTELMRLLTLMLSGSIEEPTSPENCANPDNIRGNEMRHCSGGPNSRDISNVLWACGRIQFHDRKLLLSLVDEAVRQLDNFDSHSLASLFVALGTLGLRKTSLTPDPLTPNFHETFQSQKTTPSNGSRMASSSFGHLSRPRDEARSARARVTSTLYGKLDGFDTRKLCNFFWSCGKLQWRSRPILEKAVSLLFDRITEMTPQHISNVWWTSGQLEYGDDHLLRALSDHLLSPVPNIEQQGPQNGTFNPKLRNFSQTRGENNQRQHSNSRGPNSFSDRVSHITHTSRQDPQGISNIFWALGRLMVVDIPLLNSLAEEAINKRRQLIPRNIGNIAWACGRLGFLHIRLCNCLAEEAVTKLSRFNSQNIVNVFWGLGKSGWKPIESELLPPPSCITPVVTSLLESMSEFGSQSISNMLSACVYLNWNHPVIVQALVKRAQQIYLLLACRTNILLSDEEPIRSLPLPYSIESLVDDEGQNYYDDYSIHRIEGTQQRTCTPSHHKSSVRGHPARMRSDSLGTQCRAVGTQLRRRGSWAPTTMANGKAGSEEGLDVEKHGDIVNGMMDRVVVDGQHLSNICWAVGCLQRDQHASSGDRNALCHHTYRLFSIISFLLISDSVTTITRSTNPNLKNHSTSAPTNAPKYYLRDHPSAVVQLQQVPIQQLSLILWGFASVRLRHDLLFQIVTEEIDRRLVQSETVHQRYKEMVRDSTKLRKESVESQLRDDEMAQNDIAASFATTCEVLRAAVPALCQTMWALGRVFYRHWELTERCVRLLIMDLLNFKEDKSLKKSAWREEDHSNRKSWFWRNATLQNAANILWGITVTIFASNRDLGQTAFVRAGVVMEIDPSTVDPDDHLPEASQLPGPAKMRILEDSLVQLCLATTEFYFSGMFQSKITRGRKCWEKATSGNTSLSS